MGYQPDPDFRIEIMSCLQSFFFLSCMKFWNDWTPFQTQAEVALAAADGDPSVAIEILMSQQVNNNFISFVILIL